MKNIKIIAAIILTVITVSAFYSCEKPDPYANLQLDVEEVALDIRENGKFIDALERLDDDAVPYIYDLENPVKIAVYAGSGATPEEIIIAEYADEAARTEAYKKLEAHLSAQRIIFDDYNAEYRPLLDEPLFVGAGKYLIYCVSEDYNASEAVLGRYIEK